MADIEKDVFEEENTEQTESEVTKTSQPVEKGKKSEKTKDSSTKKESKTAKPKKSFGAKLKKLWKEFKAEFRKIVWSSKKDTFNNTVLVIVSIVIVAVCISTLDYCFSELLSLLGRLI